MIYEKLLHLGLAYQQKARTSEVVQLAMEGVDQLEVYFGSYLPQLCYSILAPLTLFVVLSFVSLPCAVILFLCVPLIPITIVAVQCFAKKLLGKYWGEYTSLGDSFLENQQGLTTLKIYQADAHQHQVMNEQSERFRKITMKVLSMQLNSIIVMDLIAYGGAAVGIILAAWQFHVGHLSLFGVLLMILLAAGGVALFALRRINRYVLTGLLAGVMLLDLVPVDLRFLSSENFVSPRRNQVTASAADKAIMQDKDPGYRVLNLTVSPFNDATTSYFHRSVGGYHGAKLARYQDLIDRYLSNADDGVLDMLNTRYLIVPGKEGQPEAQRRTTAFGAAWFVDSVIYAPSAQAEIDLLGKTDLRTTAVVSGQNPAKSASRPMPLGIYASARIELTEYRPNYLKYEYTLPEEAVAVFSEIFYDQGWKAYVDGEESPYFRADYVLRAMTLPAGTHTVEWRFRAPGWTAVEGVTLAASLAILLGAVAALAYCFRKRTEKEK